VLAPSLADSGSTGLNAAPEKAIRVAVVASDAACRTRLLKWLPPPRFLPWEAPNLAAALHHHSAHPLDALVLHWDGHAGSCPRSALQLVSECTPHHLPLFVLGSRPAPECATREGTAWLDERATTAGRLRDLVAAATTARRANRASLSCCTAAGENSEDPWPERVRVALAEGQFVLYAQPILDIRSERLERFELLLRMRRQGQAPATPSSFLAAAARCGLLQAIDCWVVCEAVRLAARLRAERGPTAPAIVANISGSSLGAPNVLQVLERELSVSPPLPGGLILEVTESEAIADLPGVARRLGALCARGCRLSLDDFGTGYASFSYLRHLPLSYLKIDGTYVQNVVHSRVDRQIVSSIAELGRGLGIQTVAEWVADAATLAAVRGLGVNHAQGFHIGRPRVLSRWLPAATSTAAA
jgi:EAL domain-containing protein (putative c-di-GMP-specific phosphodiesterase class I)